MARSQGDPAQWLADARGGSREALGQALQACRDYLLLVANKELDPGLQAKGGASDLVQQTFLEAQRDFGQFQGNSEGELLAWLRHLLMNNLADFSRGFRQTAKRGIERETSLASSVFAGISKDGLLADTATPSRQAMVHEQDAALAHAMNQLPENYRQVLIWRYHEERSFEEIGTLLNRTANAARKLWIRAVERLKQELDKPHDS